jgi:hypothetical protein
MQMREWHEGQLRIIHASLGFEPDELSSLDLSAFAAEIASQGYNAQHLEYSVSWGGEQKAFLFPTSQARSVPRDVLGEYIPEAHKQGIKVFIYMNVHWVHESFAQEHPGWIQRLADGSPLTGLYGGRGSSPCVNSPWREWIFGLIEEVASNYEIDGIFLDGPCFYEGTCYCPSCQDSFRAAYGQDLPGSGDQHSTSWRDFVEFRYGSIARFVRDCRSCLQRLRPGAPLYMNANGLHSGRVNGRHNRKLVAVQDLLGAEGGFIFYGRPIDVPLWKVAGTAKFLEAQAKGKPTVIFAAAGHKPWEYPLTEPEIRLSVAATFAAGANLWIGCYRKDLQDPSLLAVAEEMSFFRTHAAELEGTEALAEAALLWSHDTADYYASSLPAIDFMAKQPEALRHLDYQASFSGAYEALMRSGSPFVIVDEEGLLSERALEGKRLLVLADCACMSERLAEAIRQFVWAAGRLVATNNSSLFDACGRQREEFLLADVFGASYAGARGLSRWDLLHLEEAPLNWLGLVRADIPSPSYQVRVRALAGSEVWGRYYQPTESRYSARPALSDDPALIYNRYGKGECLYLAGNWDHFYWTYRIAEYQRVLSGWVAERPLVAVEGDGHVLEVFLRRRRLDGAWLVHILNYTGGMERPIKSVIEAQHVRVQLRLERQPQEVRSLRLGQALAYSRDGEFVVAELPRLAHHDVLLVR